MSIYATIEHFRVNHVEVFVQGVPAHINDTGPEWDFLGPPAPEEESWLRTIFVVDRDTGKTGQRYDHWLLQLSPNEYVNLSHRELRQRVAQALKERTA